MVQAHQVMSLLCSKSSHVSQAMNGASQSPGDDLQALCTLASLYTPASLIYFFSPSLAHFTPVPLDTVSQTCPTYSHLRTFAHLSPLTRRTLLSLIFSIFHSQTSCKSLFNSHHLNRQYCPIYLKLYFTPSPHIPNYLLTSIALITYSNILYSFHLCVYCLSSPLEFIFHKDRNYSPFCSLLYTQSLK